LRPRTDGIPASWIRPAEDVSDPIVPADRAWLVAVVLGAVVIAVVAVLIRQAGADEPPPPPVPLDSIASSPAASGPAASSPAASSPAASSPAAVSSDGAADLPASASAGLPPGPERASPPRALVAPEDDDRVDPDPPPSLR
jgi:hypothetical protein